MIIIAACLVISGMIENKIGLHEALNYHLIPVICFETLLWICLLGLAGVFK